MQNTSYGWLEALKDSRLQKKDRHARVSDKMNYRKSF